MANKEDRQSVTPYMGIHNAAEAIEFYKKAFGATELMRHADPDGSVRHAEIQIGNSQLMIHDESPDFPDMKGVRPETGSPVNLFLYVDNVDAFADRAVAAGATLFAPLENKPYGRSGGLKDPYGLTWWICN